jgi:hypothetical protein
MDKWKTIVWRAKKETRMVMRHFTTEEAKRRKEKLSQEKIANIESAETSKESNYLTIEELKQMEEVGILLPMIDKEDHINLTRQCNSEYETKMLEFNQSAIQINIVQIDESSNKLEVAAEKNARDGLQEEISIVEVINTQPEEEIRISENSRTNSKNRKSKT